MTKELIELYISVGSYSDITDEEDIEQLILELSKELYELEGISSIDLIQAENLPKGAKGTSIDIGTVLVKIVEFGGISSLVATIGTWLARDKSRTLKLQLGNQSLELTGLSKTEQQDLIQWFQTQASLRLHG